MMGHTVSTFRFPSCDSFSAAIGAREPLSISADSNIGLIMPLATTKTTSFVTEIRLHKQLPENHQYLPSRIFCSNSSNVGSINSQPSGGGFLLVLRTFGMLPIKEKTQKDVCGATDPQIVWQHKLSAYMWA